MIPAVRAIGRAAMAARPVTLAELQARAELLTRFERSYLVPVEVFAEFAARLTDPRRPGGPLRSLCVNGRRWFAYQSLSYDTPDLRSFYDDRQRRRCRFKIRERLYADTGERQFEIKLRGRRGETVKRRQQLLPEDAALGHGPRRFLASVLHRAYGMAAPEELAPSLCTEYQRATFVGNGQRITCDAGLICRDLATGRAIRADGGLVLVQTKRGAGGVGRTESAAPPVDAEADADVDRMLREYGISASGFTKYCGALSALRPDLVSPCWRATVRTAFPRAAA
ncbi:polyphosphate polymerase domain-containing protein [Streptomyces sp. MST-110588]|uniref:polyphosphate polymerase domain-containing protein n=1 Tax=Streptomyces sp. MST-110588 TaxID=2833628 RepID=UPI001F5D55AA|nr:polyphosphate polymerase domain-containing protein [Streptomyces sp. MST-110588]UNO44005.1 polyphosphate polymerase domain-containing protein [Streptomyces sp. MST-110588]